jgi:hypothetical protein
MFDRVIVSPENKCSGITTCSNKHAIGFSNHKHTPITTHNSARSLGVSVSVVHFSSCDSLCQRMSTLHGCFGPCNSKFIFVLPESFPMRATVAVPCDSATRTTLHTSTSGVQSGPDHPPAEACTGDLSTVRTPAKDSSSSTEKASLRPSECHHRERLTSDPLLSGNRLSEFAVRQPARVSSGESLRTLPTALPTLCLVTLAGSTSPRVAPRSPGTSLLRTPGSIQSSMLLTCEEHGHPVVNITKRCPDDSIVRIRRSTPTSSRRAASKTRRDRP